MTLRLAAEVLFWLSALALVYTFAGYPLLVTLISTIRPRSRQRGD